MERQILSLHIPHFCVTVSRLRDPALQNRPVVVAPMVSRGKVLAFSPEAGSEGVREGMPIAEAKRLCRSLVLVPPDFSFYQDTQEEILSNLYPFSPLVESAGWGAFSLDLTGTRRLWGSGADAAVKIRERIRGAAGFAVQIGLAANKLVSRIAERLVRPLEIYSVFPGEETKFLSPLPLYYLPRIGNAIRKIFVEELGIETIGRLAGISPDLLTRVFGAEGGRLSRMAKGEDEEKVLPPLQAARLSFSVDLSEGENRRERLLSELFHLCEALGRFLRTQNRLPGKMGLEIHYADGVTVKGGHPTGDPDDDLDRSLFAKASALFERILTRRTRVTRMVLTAWDLYLPLPRLPLFSWDRNPDRARMLMAAVDQIRQRFGPNALFYGRA